MTDVNTAAQRLSNALKADDQPATEADSVDPAPEPEQTETVEAPDPEAEALPEPEVELFMVKVQGDEYEVTMDELLNGYMRGKDYEINNRKAREANEAVEAKLADIDQRLSEAATLMDFKLSRLESPQMLELKESDPEAYLKKFDEVQRDYGAYEKQRRTREKERAEAQQKHVEKEKKLLTDVIPEWLNGETLAAESKSMAEHLGQLGFDVNEINGVGASHKLTLLARKAWLYDQAKSRDLTKKEVKAPPKAVSPSAPADKADKVSREAKELRERLKRTGKVSDAAALLRM